jgi:predicted PurR-regulated permease PerM
MRKGLMRRWWDATPPAARFALLVLLVPAIALNVWVLSAIADYFHALAVVLIAASLVAFLLNYPISFMERRGAKRERAAIIVFLLAITIVFALAVTLLPVAQQQARQLVVNVPGWVASGQRQLTTLNEQLKGAGLPFSLDALEEQISDRLSSQVQSATGEALNVAALTVSSALDVLLTVVLSFYLLQHGKEIWGSLVDWLPPTMRQPFSQTVQRSFQNFFLGQLIMATSFGATLTLVFLILRVPFGLLFGLTIGTMALVPFGGTIGIVLVTVLVILRDIGLGLKVLVACVLVQQIMESLIAPRILGSVTGLNPFWVFISILTGARVAGLLGVIVAVPIAVLIKSAIVAIKVSDRELPLDSDPNLPVVQLPPPPDPDLL